MSAPYLITGVVIPPAEKQVYKKTYSQWRSKEEGQSESPIPGSEQPPLLPPARLDICDMREYNPKQFTLFLKSWARIMDKDFHPKAASFHEIAGIHGMPYVPWLGDPDEARRDARGSWLGYCNHGSILFPTWHRPYLMLLEQIIYDVARGIASEFASKLSEDEGGEWIKAAGELRLPFWDWTHPRTGESGIPEFLTTPKIMLFMPGGKYESHDNVLARYYLNHPVDGFDNRQQTNRIYNQSGTAYYREWKRTYRNPNSQAVDVREDYQGINALLTDKKVGPDGKFREGSWANLTNDVAGMFTFPIDIPVGQRANAWDEFSNTTFQSGHRNIACPEEINSPYCWHATPIEQSHNHVHLVVGGIGHMADNDTAAFDPIFYLHHCNVDRLLAFWEHIYPDYTAGTEGFLEPDGYTRTPFTQGGGTWIQNNNQVVDIQSPLWPFRNSTYGYWTSQDTHSLTLYRDPNRPATIPPNNKYYTYPGIKFEGHEIKIDTNPSNPTPAKERNKQRAYLQRYFRYDPIKARDGCQPVYPRIFSEEAPYSGLAARASGRKRVKNYRQFIVSVSLDPTLIKGSHMLVVLANVPDNRDGIPRPLGKLDETCEIGRVAVLARGSSESCGNCQAQRAARARVRGIIMVPHAIVAHILSTVGLNKEDSDDDVGDLDRDLKTQKVIESISLCLNAALVLPDGTLHSQLQNDIPKRNEQILTGDALPRLELWSCDVYQASSNQASNEVEDDVPYDFDDWKRHTTLNEAGGFKRRWF